MRKLFPFLLLSVISVGANAQTSSKPDTASLVEYKGTYKFPPGSATESVEITIRDGSLYGTSTIGAATLVRVSKDTFNLQEYNGLAYFSRNAKKQVNHIHIEAGDVILDGDKEGISNTVAWRIRKRLPVAVK